MNYFQPYLPPLDDAIVAAWDSQVAEAAETPLLAQALAQSADLFPRFAACYAQLRALPRGARRALQRQLARSSELAMVSPEWQQKLARSLAGAALLLALLQGVSEAATITVNIANPAVNTLDTKCSLIEAIINAENDDQSGSTQCAAGSGDDTIVLAKVKKKALNITLTSSYYGSYYGDGLPAITTPITIMGNGGKIARSGGASPFRIVTVTSTGSLTLQTLTLSGGYAYDNGGAINNLGTLVIDKATVSGNTASNGGAVYNYRYSSLTITNGSAISNNRSSTGGGIFNAPDSTVTITNSTLSGNSATDGPGGGAYNGPGAALTITNSTLSGNTAGTGGAYYNAGAGGAVYTNSGTLTITNSTISGNTARGAYYGGRGAGVFAAYADPTYDGGRVTISDSTIAGNTATNGVANPSYASPDSFGGGIFNSNGTSETNNYLTLNRSLISGNSATNGSQIANFQPVTVDVYTTPYNSGYPYYNYTPGFYTTVNVVTADNFNLFGSNNDAGIYNDPSITPLAAGTTDIVPPVGVTLAKILGPLKANGGLTQTRALVAKTSPALKKVTSGCPATDQRGTKRPQPSNTSCDIGSFEQK
jgi:hypothetical protein